MIRALDERLLRWADAGATWLWNEWGVRKLVLTRSMCFLSAGVLFVGVHQLHFWLVAATVLQLVTQGLVERDEPMVVRGRAAVLPYRMFVLGLTVVCMVLPDHTPANVLFIVWYYFLFARVPPGPRRRRERETKKVEALQGAS